MFFSKHCSVEIILMLEISQVFSSFLYLLLFPLEPCLHMAVLLGNQCIMDRGDFIHSLTRSCPVDLVCNAHFLEHQFSLQYYIFKHFPSGDVSAGIETVSSFQIISNNNNRVKLHSVALHPYLSLQFQVFKSLLCSTFHPRHALCPVRSRVAAEVVVDPRVVNIFRGV